MSSPEMNVGVSDVLALANFFTFSIFSGFAEELSADRTYSEKLAH